VATEGGLPPIAGGSQEADAGGIQDPTARSSQQSDPRSSEQAGGAEPPETGPIAHQRRPSWLPAYPALVFVAVVFAAATVFFGIIPQPLFHFADHAGRALVGLP
jgi:hypothetical protein